MHALDLHFTHQSKASLTFRAPDSSLRTAFWASLILLAGAAPMQAVLPSAPTQAAVMRMFDAWRAPVPPRHLLANIYYVGASGVSSFLITTPEGHILLDTGFDDTVPIIREGVTQLGFKLTDIKIIISSHAHIDHVGGHALMQKLTGARIYASAGDARLLASGGTDDFIPFPRETIVYAPVTVDHVVADGEHVTLGNVTLTAHLTPGHTRGATTWTMDAVVDGALRRIVFFSSTTINAGTRLLHNPLYPEIVREFETTLTRLKALPCDIFFAPHGGQFGMAEKIARLDRDETPNPFIDPDGWRNLVTRAERTFRDQLAAERAAERNSGPDR
ncbi:Metallo-beta-lactamase L1 [uncultured Defluviicoccus sp.]|uniref:Metallo-beta-lactamase L1 n=1 Tax=metagenome TaxID=256318 RepID=A0A380TFX7_9ZZZZ|nr:Metallo-beta-lactamase L1 [uncultured Defluviicoccus sp.]